MKGTCCLAASIDRGGQVELWSHRSAERLGWRTGALLGTDAELTDFAEIGELELGGGARTIFWEGLVTPRMKCSELN